ncbi:MAG: phytanoyl-CoA dioxygenase family protein [Steroidobacteraceae bacterium]
MSSVATSGDVNTQRGLMDQLALDGFVLLHQLCGSELVESVLDVCRRRAHDIRMALGAKEIGIGSAAGYVEIVQRSPGRWDVPITLQQFGIDNRKMPWWPLVAAVLGEDAEPSFSGVVTSEPGSPAQYWHTDSPHEAPEHRAAHAINVLMALHDIPMAMGPTECACGSHFLTNHMSNPSLVIDELIYQHSGTSPESLVKGTQCRVPESFTSPMAAGSCLVFDDRLLHRGLANRSSALRHVAYFSYRRKGYCVNTHFESRRSVFDQSS